MRTDQHPNTIYIEYCKDCSSHQWNTRHIEHKYEAYFQKLASYLQREFPEYRVLGNAVPHHFKLLQRNRDQIDGDSESVAKPDNKYFDTKSRKMTIFPDIGAFEVSFNGKLLFSKKKTNSWPDFRDIQLRIDRIKNGEQQQQKNIDKHLNKPKQQNLRFSSMDKENIVFRDSDHTQRDTVTFTHKNIEIDDRRTTFYQADQKKNFTLTDHFKLYKMKKNKIKNELVKQKRKHDLSEPPKNILRLKSDPKGFKKSWEEISLRSELPEFIKNKAYFKDEKGKREMIINLDSIQQEHQQCRASTKRQNKPESRKNKNNEVIQSWNQDLNFVENKFQKIENKMSKFNKKKEQIERAHIPLEEEWLEKINRAQAQGRNSSQRHHENQQQQTSFLIKKNPRQQKSKINPYVEYENRPSSGNKINMIDQYLNSSQADKNKKLHKIYGQWKVLKNEPNHPKKRKQKQTKIKLSDSQSEQQNQSSELVSKPNKKNQKMEKIGPEQKKINKFMTERTDPIKGVKYRTTGSNQWPKSDNKAYNKTVKESVHEQSYSDYSEDSDSYSQFSYINSQKHHQPKLPKLKASYSKFNQKNHLRESDSDDQSSYYKEKSPNFKGKQHRDKSPKLQSDTTVKKKDKYMKNVNKKPKSSIIQPQEEEHHPKKVLNNRNENTSKSQQKPDRNKSQSPKIKTAHQQKNEHSFHKEKKDRKSDSIPRKDQQHNKNRIREKRKKMKQENEQFRVVQSRFERQDQRSDKNRSTLSNNQQIEEQSDEQTDFYEDQQKSNRKRQGMNQNKKQQERRKDKQKLQSRNKKLQKIESQRNNQDSFNQGISDEERKGLKDHSQHNKQQQNKKIKNRKKQGRESEQNSYTRKVKEEQQYLQQQNFKDRQADSKAKTIDIQKHGNRDKQTKQLQTTQGNSVKHQQSRVKQKRPIEQSKLGKIQALDKTHKQSKDRLNKQQKAKQSINEHGDQNQEQSGSEKSQGENYGQKQTMIKVNEGQEKQRQNHKKKDLTNTQSRGKKHKNLEKQVQKSRRLQDTQKQANRLESSQQSHQYPQENKAQKGEAKKVKQQQKLKNKEKGNKNNGIEKNSQIRNHYDDKKNCDQFDQRDDRDRGSIQKQSAPLRQHQKRKDSDSDIYQQNQKSRAENNPSENISDILNQKEEAVFNNKQQTTKNNDSPQKQVLSQKQKNQLEHKKPYQQQPQRRQPHQKELDQQPHQKERDQQPHQKEHDQQPHQKERDQQPHQKERDQQPHQKERDQQPHQKERDQQPHQKELDQQFHHKSDHKENHQSNHKEHYQQSYHNEDDHQSDNKEDDQERQHLQQKSYTLVSGDEGIDQKNKWNQENKDDESSGKNEDQRITGQKISLQNDHRIREKQEQSKSHKNQHQKSSRKHPHEKSNQSNQQPSKQKSPAKQSQIKSINNQADSLKQTNKQGHHQQQLNQQKINQTNEQPLQNSMEQNVQNNKQQHIKGNKQRQQVKQSQMKQSGRGSNKRENKTEMEQLRNKQSKENNENIQKVQQNSQDQRYQQQNRYVQNQTKSLESESSHTSHNSSERQSKNEQQNFSLQSSNKCEHISRPVNRDSVKKLSKQKTINNLQQQKSQQNNSQVQQEVNSSLLSNQQLGNNQHLNSTSQEQILRSEQSISNYQSVYSSKINSPQNIKRKHSKKKESQIYFSNVITQSRPPLQHKIQVEMISVGTQKHETGDFSHQTSPESIHRNQHNANPDNVLRDDQIKKQKQDNGQKNNNESSATNQKIKVRDAQKSQGCDSAQNKSGIKFQKKMNVRNSLLKATEQEQQSSDASQPKVQQGKSKLEGNNKISENLGANGHKEKPLKPDNEQLNLESQILQGYKSERSDCTQQQEQQNRGAQKEQQQPNQIKYKFQTELQQKLKSQLLKSSSSHIQTPNHSEKGFQPKKDPSKTKISTPQNHRKPTKTQQSPLRELYIDSNLGPIGKTARIRDQLYGYQNDQQKIFFDNLFRQQSKPPKVLDFPLHYKSNFQKWVSIQEIQRSSGSQIPLFINEEYPEMIFGQNTSQQDPLTFNRYDLKSFRRILKIIRYINPYLVIRLFDTSYRNKDLYGVWLCKSYVWKCYAFDDKIPVDQGCRPVNTAFINQSDQQGWVYLLEKALALALGGYQELERVSVGKLFHMMTGSNILSHKIREDLQKTQKILKNIKNFIKKNFLVYCENSSHNTLRRKDKQENLFVIRQIKYINESQMVIELQQLSGHNSHQSDRFWIKGEKFVQQFINIEILQIRLNHNTTRLSTINNGKNLTILTMDFEAQSFGSITLSNQNKTGFLKVSLYKQGGENILKLVGQAKQKKKHQIFFDCLFGIGLYHLFIESEHKGSIVAYNGQGKPELRVRQQVSSQSYKNDYTEYLPINKQKFGKSRQNIPLTSQLTDRNKTTIVSQSKFRDQSINGEDRYSKIKEQFIEFLLKDKNNEQ